MSKIFTIFIIIIITLGLSAYFIWVSAGLAKDPSNKEFKSFTISQGENTDQIISRLYSEGFIKNKTVFKLILRKENLSGKLQAGIFRLSPSFSSKEIAVSLTHGVNDIWVTIPEGLRREEIFTILTDAGFKIDYNLWQEKTKNYEGYLFPDTYRLPASTDLDQIIILIRKNFDTKTIDLKNLINNQNIIFASLIEREVKTDKDRPIVAGILKKRLANNWSLEIDATVQYAVGSQKNWWPQITADDLLIDSKYNTRKYQGLPPSPICNPGFLSIKASIYPQGSDYWFYLSDNKGEIHYAKTLEEHENNIVKYIE